MWTLDGMTGFWVHPRMNPGRKLLLTIHKMPVTKHSLAFKCLKLLFTPADNGAISFSLLAVIPRDLRPIYRLNNTLAVLKKVSSKL